MRMRGKLADQKPSNVDLAMDNIRKSIIIREDCPWKTVKKGRLNTGRLNAKEPLRQAHLLLEGLHAGQVGLRKVLGLEGLDATSHPLIVHADLVSKALSLVLAKLIAARV